VLYAMCTGVPPFRGSTAVSVLRLVSDGDPTPVRTLNPDVPAWLDSLIVRLLAKKPADRFQSAAEVAELLEGYLAHLRQPETTPAPNLPHSALAASTGGHGDMKMQRGWLRFRLPVALGLGLCVGVAIWLGLGTTDGPTGKPDSASQVPGNLKAEFHQDFRNFDVNQQQVLRAVGTEVYPEDRGVRITLPAGQGVLPHTGFVTNFPVRGDFEMTLAYEILKEETPAKGYGVGIAMLAEIDSEKKLSFSLGRRLRTNGMVSFTGSRKAMPSISTSGKLRLRRVGSVVHYLAADGSNSEFVELEEMEVGTADLQFVRVAGTAGESESGLDARLLDFTIRAEELPGMPELESSHESGWKIWVVVALAVVVSAGVVLVMRRGRQATKVSISAPDAPKQVRPDAATKVVSLQCSTCGKSLNAKAELAGKKVKCPKCGNVVLVPTITTRV